MLSSAPVLRWGLEVPPNRGETLGQKRRDGTLIVNSTNDDSGAWRIKCYLTRGLRILQTGRAVKGRRGYGEGVRKTKTKAKSTKQIEQWNVSIAR